MIQQTLRFAVVIASSVGISRDALALDLPVRTPAEFTDAVKAAKPGDSITLADGEWRDADLLLSAEGAETAPITLRAQIPGRVVLSGKSRLRISGRHLVVEGLRLEGITSSDDLLAFSADSKRVAQHCRLTQGVIVDCRPDDPRSESKWVSLYGAHNRVDHCYFAGKQHAGATLVVWLSDEPNHHRIDHNHFGPRQPLGRNGGETIRVGDSNWSLHDSHTVVEQNLFTRCDGEAEIVSNKSCGNVYRGNTFVECSGTLTLRHGNRCRVDANFFLGNGARGSGGVRIIGEDHRVVNNYFADLTGDDTRSALTIMNGLPDSPLHGYFQVRNAYVGFNSFVNCKRSLTVGAGESRNTLPPVDCTIANNLLASQKGTLVEQLREPQNCVWRGNLFHGQKLGIMPADGITLADPKLNLAADGLWRPGDDSPADRKSVV